MKVDIQQAAEKRRVPMARILYESKEGIVAIESKIDKQIELRKKSKARIDAAKKMVTEAVKELKTELIRVLNDHEKAMTEKLTKADEKQEKDHKAQLKQFQMFANELNCSVEHAVEIFQRGSAQELLQEEHFVFAPCKDLLSQCRKMKVFKPEDVNYAVNKRNLKALRQLIELPLGQVNMNDHSQSVAKGKV